MCSTTYTKNGSNGGSSSILNLTATGGQGAGGNTSDNGDGWSGAGGSPNGIAGGSIYNNRNWYYSTPGGNNGSPGGSSNGNPGYIICPTGGSNGLVALSWTEPPTVCLTFDPINNPCITQTSSSPTFTYTPTPAAVPVSSGGGGGCFIAGTTVLMSDNTIKNIEDVTYNDFLMTSGGVEEVMKIYHIPYKGLVYAFNGDENYFVTPTHPFMTTEGWKSLDPEGTRRESPGIEVTRLKVGDILIMKDNKRKVLTKLDSKEVSTTVYNFGVNGTHDFYADDYLVHNVSLGIIEKAHASTPLYHKY
jgi:hypothetical protein